MDTLTFSSGGGLWGGLPKNYYNISHSTYEISHQEPQVGLETRTDGLVDRQL